MTQTPTFFEGCFSEQEIKARYRALCKTHHPDLGGDTATMQDINAQYSERLRGEYRKTKTAEEADAAVAADQETAEKLAEIIRFPGLEIEIVGCWIWVTGDTFSYRAQLKEAGFFWASKKVAWYWRKAEDACTRGGKKSLEQLRATYGSVRVPGQYTPALA